MDRRIHRHDRIDSTSERAFLEIEGGRARNFDVHVAREQTAGRGQRGRRWESAPDEGWYGSIVLFPDPPPPHPALFTMAAGLGVVGACRELGLEDATLKWPNDVLVGGAKLAGILVETRGLDPEHPHAVVGIGLNVGQERFPKALTAERAVTSLRLEGRVVDLGRAEEVLLAQLTPWLEGACAGDETSIAPAYLEATGLRGRSVAVEMGRGESTHGRVVDLGLPGGLRLQLADGGSLEIPLERILGLRAL